MIHDTSSNVKGSRLTIHTDDPTQFLQTIRTMLDDQYVHMESYCQAQTIVNNLVLTSRPTTAATAKKGSNSQNRSIRSRNNDDSDQNHGNLLQAMKRLVDSRQQVNQDWKSWQGLVASVSKKTQDNNNDDDDDDIITHQQQHLQQHLALSQRILQTIYQPTHTNGIQKIDTATSNYMTGGQGGGRHQANTLALASLRASAARLLDQSHKTLQI